MNDHEHDWRAVGECTHNGDTWMQVSRVFFCPACGASAITENPIRYYDYKRRKPEEVARLRAEEQAAYDALIDECTADPAGVEARYKAGRAAEHERIQALIAEARLERVGRTG